MKLFFLLAALVVIFIGLSHSHASMNYSPLDSYCKAVVKNHNDSIRHANEVKMFLDSLKESDYVKERLMDYQIYLKMDTLRLYDGERLVGEHIDSNYNHGAFIDSTILNDNQ